VSVPLEQIGRMATEIVRQFSRGLPVVGVTANEGSTDRVEVLIGLGGCHTGECRIMLNLPRTDTARFEAEFPDKLRVALQQHERGS